MRIALNYKQLPHALIPVDLKESQQFSDSFRQINAQQLVPVLELTDGQRITQSTAILEWLEEHRPQPPLLPADSIPRAKVRSWCGIIASDIHPINNLRVLKYLSKNLNADERQITAWYQHWIAKGFEVLEEQLEGSPYCFGKQLTLADIYLIPQVYNARRYKLDLSPFPKIVKIDEYCQSQLWFVRAHPDNQ